MKHIKKRFLLESQRDEISFNKEKFEVLDIDKNFDNKKLNGKKKSIAFVATEKNFVIAGFVHKVDGRNYIFPVPDPTLIYFHNAQTSIAKIKEHKTKLLKKLDFNQDLSETAINEIYNFYSVTTGFVIYLFTSIESYINQHIPDNFVFKKVTNKRTELYDKKQIQEGIDFKTKITEVLSEATGKNFFGKDTPTNQNIWKLKTFRDEIIHTKPGENPLRYDDLIRMSLNFRYSDTLDAVAKFMNHYKTDYITECGCGVDF